MLVVCFLNGKVSPNCSILSFLGESAQLLAHLTFSKALKACFVAEALLGVGFLSM